MPSARTKEMTEAQIVQVVSVGQMEDSESDEEPFFQFFAAKKKKHEIRRSRLPEFHPFVPLTPTSAIPSTSAPPIPTASSDSAPPAPVPATSVVPSVSAAAAPSAPASVTAHHTPQYRYQSTAEDQQLIIELQSLLMEGKLAESTPAHILAASPAIRKCLADKLRVCKVEATSFEETASVQVLTLCSYREYEYS